MSKRDSPSDPEDPANSDPEEDDASTGGEGADASKASVAPPSGVVTRAATYQLPHVRWKLIVGVARNVSLRITVPLHQEGPPAK